MQLNKVRPEGKCWPANKVLQEPHCDDNGDVHGPKVLYIKRITPSHYSVVVVVSYMCNVLHAHYKLLPPYLVSLTRPRRCRPGRRDTRRPTSRGSCPKAGDTQIHHVHFHRGGSVPAAELCPAGEHQHSGWSLRCMEYGSPPTVAVTFAVLLSCSDGGAGFSQGAAVF